MNCNTPEKFWARIRMGSLDECWEWMGTRIQNKQYGQLSFQGEHWLAHRLAYFLFNGRLPENQVCHTCDNPPCCNPNHLYDGTRQENILDAQTHGAYNNSKTRQHKIKQASRAMRLDDQTERIMDLYYNKHLQMWRIGLEIGLSESGVSRIINKNRRTTKFSNLSI